MYDLNISFHSLYFIVQIEYNNISIAVFTNYKIKIYYFSVVSFTCIAEFRGIPKLIKTQNK